MNQEAIMKRKMIRAIILFIITFIAMLIFIGLYIDETKRVQRTYRNQYRTELRHVSGEITAYMKTEGGYAIRYSTIISYMSNAGSYAFLIDDFNDEQKTINEVSTALIKYPEQMSTKLEELNTAVNDILDGLDKGYDEAQAIVDSLDKKGK